MLHFVSNKREKNLKKLLFELAMCLSLSRALSFSLPLSLRVRFDFWYLKLVCHKPFFFTCCWILSASHLKLFN